jgi:hypothetical protein
MNSNYELPALFVNWQDDGSRRIFPVGRLVKLKADGYEFASTSQPRAKQRRSASLHFRRFPTSLITRSMISSN